MSRSWFVVIAPVAALTASCSHQPRPTASPASARVIALPSPKAPLAAPPPIAAANSEMSKSKEGNAIYFDFDSATLREDARPVLQEVAEKVRRSDKALRIEGNCDELGTVEYNLALGEHRARAAREYLVHMGVPSDRVATVSYGSQHPKYSGHDEQAHAKNRRDDLVVH